MDDGPKFQERGDLGSLSINKHFVPKYSDDFQKHEPDLNLCCSPTPVTPVSTTSLLAWGECTVLLAI